MRFHGGIVPALQHASTWSALAGLFAVSANGLWPPYTHMSVIAGVLCGVMGILLRSPDMDKDDQKEQCDANNHG